jgi:hypothetical protein
VLFFLYQPLNILFKPQFHEPGVKHRSDGLRDRLQAVRRSGHFQVLELPFADS